MVATGGVRRGEVYLVALDRTRGAEIRKTRPCVVVSPDELNQHLRTVVIAPLTSVTRPLPFRVTCTFQGRRGQVVADQLRTVDRERLVRRLGRLSDETRLAVLAVLRDMFAP